jgi:hypothetical protein
VFARSYVDLVAWVPVVVAVVVWNWSVDKRKAEKPSEDVKIGLIAQKQGKERFERWQVVDALMRALAIMAAVLVAAYVLFNY